MVGILNILLKKANIGVDFSAASAAKANDAG